MSKVYKNKFLEILTIISVLFTIIDFTCFLCICCNLNYYTIPVTRYRDEDLLDSIIDCHTNIVPYENLQCSICLDNNKASFIVIKKCNHKFHYICLKQYFISSYPILKCPLCRCIVPVL